MNSLSMTILLIVVGLILSLNPFSVSVFTALLAGALDKAHNKHRTRLIAMTYLWFYWLFIAVIGVLLVWLLSLMSNKNLQVTALVISVLAIIFGMAVLARYLWEKPYWQIPQKLKHFILKHSVKKSHPANATVLATLTCLVSLISIGPQLLALAIIVALLTPTAYWWMLLPAAALILPLKLIYFQVLKGYKSSTILRWRDETKITMRLSFALVHIALGWIILLILNGSIGSAL